MHVGGSESQGGQYEAGRYRLVQQNTQGIGAEPGGEGSSGLQGDDRGEAGRGSESGRGGGGSGAWTNQYQQLQPGHHYPENLQSNAGPSTSVMGLHSDTAGYYTRPTFSQHAYPPTGSQQTPQNAQYRQHYGHGIRHAPTEQQFRFHDHTHNDAQPHLSNFDQPWSLHSANHNVLLQHGHAISGDTIHTQQMREQNLRMPLVPDQSVPHTRSGTHHTTQTAYPSTRHQPHPPSQSFSNQAAPLQMPLNMSQSDTLMAQPGSFGHNYLAPGQHSASISQPSNLLPSPISWTFPRGPGPPNALPISSEQPSESSHQQHHHSSFNYQFRASQVQVDQSDGSQSSAVLADLDMGNSARISPGFQLHSPFHASAPGPDARFEPSFYPLPSRDTLAGFASSLARPIPPLQHDWRMSLGYASLNSSETTLQTYHRSPNHHMTAGDDPEFTVSTAQKSGNTMSGAAASKHGVRPALGAGRSSNSGKGRGRGQDQGTGHKAATADHGAASIGVDDGDVSMSWVGQPPSTATTTSSTSEQETDYISWSRSRASDKEDNLGTRVGNAHVDHNTAAGGGSHIGAEGVSDPDPDQGLDRYGGGDQSIEASEEGNDLIASASTSATANTVPTSDLASTPYHREGKRRNQNRMAQRAFRARSKVQNKESAQHLVQLTQRNDDQAQRIKNLTHLVTQLQRENFALKSDRWKESLDEHVAVMGIAERGDRPDQVDIQGRHTTSYPDTNVNVNADAFGNERSVGGSAASN